MQKKCIRNKKIHHLSRTSNIFKPKDYFIFSLTSVYKKNYPNKT